MRTAQLSKSVLSHSCYRRIEYHMTSLACVTSQTLLTSFACVTGQTLCQIIPWSRFPFT